MENLPEIWANIDGKQGSAEKETRPVDLLPPWTWQVLRLVLFLDGFVNGATEFNFSLKPVRIKFIVCWNHCVCLCVCQVFARYEEERNSQSEKYVHPEFIKWIVLGEAEDGSKEVRQLVKEKDKAQFIKNLLKVLRMVCLSIYPSVRV